MLRVWNTNRTSMRSIQTATTAPTSRPVAAIPRSRTTTCTSSPMRTNSEPLSNCEPSGQADSVCRRDAAGLIRAEADPTARPATATASAPGAAGTAAGEHAGGPDQLGDQVRDERDEQQADVDRRGVAQRPEHEE